MDLRTITRDHPEIHLPRHVHGRQKKQERFNFSTFLEKRAYGTIAAGARRQKRARVKKY
jgi:hypothetical protein